MTPTSSSFLLRLSLVSTLLVLLAPTLTLASDWPQWRGPERSGQAIDFEPPGEWPAQLKQVFKVEVGQADSSPVIADGKAIVFTRIGGNEDTSETLSAFDLTSGELIWRESYSSPFKPLTIVAEHGSGPYSTPTVNDGRVFTVGITGVLTAWSLDDGKQIWQRAFDDQFKKGRPFYGASQSPLVTDGKLIVHVGGPMDGALAAFDPATGDDIWRFKTDGPAYGSGVVATLSGQKQFVGFTQRNLVGVDLESGKQLWNVPYLVNFDATHLTPSVIDGKVIISADKTPTRAYQPKANKKGKWSVDVVWENDQVWMTYSSPVVLGGRLFAFASQKKGQLVELAPDTGEILWSAEPRSGEVGWLVAAADLILLVTDGGDLSVYRPNEKGADKVASYQVADSTVWAHPALVGEGLLVKDKDHLMMWSFAPE